MTTESQTTFPDRPRVAVGAVIFKDGRVLLVRRGRSPARSQWAIPGGSVELGETLQEAAEREIHEETGIRIRAGEPVFVFDVVERDASGRIRFHYVIVDLEGRFLEGEPRPGDDAVAVRWVGARELDRLPVNRTTRKLLKKVYRFG